jgi:hypothetical protein
MFASVNNLPPGTLAGHLKAMIKLNRNPAVRNIVTTVVSTHR